MLLCQTRLLCGIFYIVLQRFCFLSFFFRENSYVSGAFFSSCDRFHSNLNSPRDLHFGSVSDWRSDCCRIERKQLIFLFYFLFSFLFYTCSLTRIALTLRSPVVRNIHNFVHSVQPLIWYAEALHSR